jgi:hypothetical protein
LFAVLPRTARYIVFSKMIRRAALWQTDQD